MHPHEVGLDEIEAIDEDVNEADGVFRADVVIHRLEQKKQLVAFETGYVRHAEFYSDRADDGILRTGFPTSFRTVCMISAQRLFGSPTEGQLDLALPR